MPVKQSRHKIKTDTIFTGITFLKIPITGSSSCQTLFAGRQALLREVV